ncbi:MAG: DUF2807 domain-containing protein [Myxococcota bacterium]|nr:DUF2807 domain-containing protein [Myxococcota bacterium]
MRHIPLLALLVGCAEPVIGDGLLVEDARALSGFTSVETYGVNVRVALGEADDVVINTDSNVQPYVLTSIEDGVLRIEADGELYPSALTALVVVESLESVGNYDGADMWVSGIDSDTFTVQASGNGNTELLGEVDTLDIISTGAGVRNASELTASMVTINMSGAGTAWITALDSIEGDISSESILNVFGDPVRKAVTSDSASEIVYY